MPKLNPNAQKWVDALRSGKFRQGESQLKIDDPDDPRHCCLGVLCEVARVEGLDFGFLPDDSYLPETVMEWVGLKSQQAHYRERTRDGNSEDGSLVQMNDSGASFAEIADFIEERAEQLGVAGRETELAEVGQ
jgi:hypothetical protein